MARRIQAALAKDPRVVAAVTGALGARSSTGRGMLGHDKLPHCAPRAGLARSCLTALATEASHIP